MSNDLSDVAQPSSESLQRGHGQHHPHHSDLHPHHSLLHQHTTSALKRGRGLDLEAANIAHFDALGADFDKQHPFAAEFADRLVRTLLRRHPTTSQKPQSQIGDSDNGSGGSGAGGSSLVLDEDATAVLDYACGSGMYAPARTPFASALAWCSFFSLFLGVFHSIVKIYIYFLCFYLGQVSRALAPYVAQLVGVDISPRMVEVYNTRANTQGLEPHEMRAVASLAELQQQRFDLAVVRTARQPARQIPIPLHSISPLSETR